ncbi:MAG: phosphohistidine phosphatase SixA [Deltaproteobacteria bacterium]|nr:phosphohistidine phosphatase SixA [Deltaproteobacteria bacterium]
MNIYLMQHGQPVPKEKDPNKPLSAQGVEDIHKMAAFLQRAGITVHTIFHSGKTRARETAEIMASRLTPGSEPEERKGLSPLDDVREVAEKLNQGRKDAMIVGHLPHLARLTSLLTTGSDTDLVATFQQGGVVCLRPIQEKQGWAIAWMLVPEMIP